MKKFIIFTVLIIAFLIFYLINKTRDEYGQIVIGEIKKEYNGVVLKKFSTRKKLPETFLKIESRDTIFDLSVSEDVARFVSVGDTLIKLKNSNILTIKKPFENRKFYYRPISKSLRNHKNFPKEWKNKWKDSI